MSFVPLLCNIRPQSTLAQHMLSLAGSEGTLNFGQLLETLKKLHKPRVSSISNFVPGGGRAGKRGGGGAGGAAAGRWPRWRPRARPWCSTPTAWSAGSPARTCCNHLCSILKLGRHRQHSEHCGRFKFSEDSTVTRLVSSPRVKSLKRQEILCKSNKFCSRIYSRTHIRTLAATGGN